MLHPTTQPRQFLMLLLYGALALTANVHAQTVPPVRQSLTEPAGVQKKAKPSTPVATTPLPGMPTVLDPQDIYTADRPNQLSPAVKNFPSRVYVPNSESNSVDIIDPTTLRVIDHFEVGQQPQHIVPTYDLKTLWVLDDKGNGLTRIDPATGKEGETVPVDDPYNLYFTPNGADAIVVAESLHRLDFRDPKTMTLKYSLPVPCDGVNHMDFSADGRYLIASCEFDGKLLKVDVTSRTVLATLRFRRRSMPQDVRLSPDGSVFYVADMGLNGVHEIDGNRFSEIAFLRTGKGTHGLYVSRDSKFLYISNRGEGSISVLDFSKRKIVTRWRIPHGGSPDMGGVSADGNVLWLAGRYDSEVYAIDTSSGKLVARIRVGKGPHGLCVYPQPGRYSMGHTGIFR
jgi:YVTN family beta-propeller protein